MMARSNKKRLNDDDESFGKSNKQPVLSVAAPPPLPQPLPFAPRYGYCQPPDDGGRTAAVVAAVESPPYLALVELEGSQSLITRIFNPWLLP